MGYSGEALKLIVLGVFGLFLFAVLMSMEVAAWRHERRRTEVREELAETLTIRGLAAALDDTAVFPRLRGKRHRR